MAEVILDPLGFAYVPLNIKPNSSAAMVEYPYKIDTGANSTTINKERLNELGFDDIWIKKGRLLTGDERPTVATGKPVDNCYVVSIPEINIGGYVGYNWPFLVSLNKNIHFRLLLGTDSLSFFNWNFDYENGICKFDIISGKRKLLFNQKEQSIHTIDEIED